jgi:hypothetical protein
MGSARNPPLDLISQPLVFVLTGIFLLSDSKKIPLLLHYSNKRFAYGKKMLSSSEIL